MSDPGPQHRVGEQPDVIELDDGRRMPHIGDPASRHRRSHPHVVPPAGFEPAPPPPEGGALSPELRGLGHAEASSERAMIIGVKVVPVASPLWLVPGASSSSMTTM